MLTAEFDETLGFLEGTASPTAFFPTRPRFPEDDPGVVDCFGAPFDEFRRFFAGMGAPTALSSTSSSFTGESPGVEDVT